MLLGPNLIHIYYLTIINIIIDPRNETTLVPTNICSNGTHEKVLYVPIVL